MDEWRLFIATPSMQEPRDRQRARLVGLTHPALAVVAQLEGNDCQRSATPPPMPGSWVDSEQHRVLNFAVDALRYSRKWFSATLGLATRLLGLNAFVSREACISLSAITRVVGVHRYTLFAARGAAISPEVS
jgi:hypothetical protein